MKKAMPKQRPKRKQQTTAQERQSTLKPFIHAAVDSAVTFVRTTPVGAVILAGLAFQQRDALPAAFMQAIPALSYLILGFGLVITACFNRGRAFFVLLALLLSQWAMLSFAPAHVDGEFVRHSLYVVLSLLLPVNILFFSLVEERGIFSNWGRRCLLAVLCQAAILLGMVWTGDAALFFEFERRFIPGSWRTPLPDMALTAFTAAVLGVLAVRRRVNVHFRVSMLCVIATVAAAYHFYSLSPAIPLFYAAAGLVLILAVMQDYYFKAYLDELTGLPSRRSLNEAMLQMEGTYVVAMLDVDFFKHFNDTYGHEAGDDVLRLIAGVMKTFKAGKPFRYGGEEFTFLLPRTTLDEAMPQLEGLREKIAKRKFLLRRGKAGGKRILSVTVSIGAAESSPKHDCCDDVIRAADAALYRAKESGRNCVSR